MRVLSLFSGAGGMDLGLERAGMTIAGLCELGYAIDVDPDSGDEVRRNVFTREVLARHWPDIPCHDDVTTLDPGAFRDRVDLVAGGSPCQDLSVAGRRAGLGGERSGLFWHQCRIADQVDAPWVLWENVAGALSSNDGADFAAVLWGLTGALPDVPDGGWRTAGVCVGPKRVAVWRLFDARWFGVAQRRRRVFVVAGPRDGRAVQVLLEPEGVRGDPAPGGDAGPDTAVGTLAGTGPRGGWRFGADEAAAGHLIPTHTGTVNTQVEEGCLVPAPMPFDTTQVTHRENRSNPQPGDPSPTLSRQGHPPAIAFGWSNSAAQGDDVVVDATAALRTKMQPAVAYPLAMRGRDDGAEMEMGEADVANTLRAGSGGAYEGRVLTPELAVRRLTPRECERLQGWPDDHTRWTDDGREIADSHRYRMIGNGVASPVTEWIGRRMIGAAP